MTNLSNELRAPQKESITELGVIVEYILGEFWQDQTVSPVMRDMQVENWIDVLKYYNPHEVMDAWKVYQKDGPRTAKGKLCKPDAGAIYNLVIKARKQKAPSPASREVSYLPYRDPSEKRADPEVVNKILEEAGFNSHPFAKVMRQ